LTAKEICEIISACASANVSEITMHDMRIVFGSKAIASENSSNQTENLVVEDAREPAVERKESLAQLEEEIDETLLTDPVAFEEAMTSQEFLDEKDQVGSGPT
jgi:hypothetical protein